MARFVRTPEVAEYTHLSERTIRKYVLDKSIPYIKKHGAVLFNLDQIDEWLMEGSIPVLERKANTTASEVGRGGAV